MRACLPRGGFFRHPPILVRIGNPFYVTPHYYDPLAFIHTTNVARNAYTITPKQHTLCSLFVVHM